MSSESTELRSEVPNLHASHNGTTPHEAKPARLTPPHKLARLRPLPPLHVTSEATSRDGLAKPRDPFREQELRAAVAKHVSRGGK